MQQTCKKCGLTKPFAEFYASNKTRCKECQRTAVKQHRADNVEKVKAYDQSRANLPHRVAARQAYFETDRGKERQTAGRVAWQKRNPVKRTAHNILNAAVRDGKIIKPKRCSRCGEAGRIHAHHHDYSKPLAVEWLCSPCHREEHKTGE